MSSGVLGVDVSLGRGLDAVLLEDSTVKETWSRLGPHALQELLEEHRPIAGAIDAPPASGKGLLREESERARLRVPPAPGSTWPGGWRNTSCRAEASARTRPTTRKPCCSRG